MKFTEEKLEETFAELLEKEGYRNTLGSDLIRNLEDVLIEEDLREFLVKQYTKFSITNNEVQSIILQLKTLSASDLYESNKSFLRMLSDGFILKREDRNQKDIYIHLLDYTKSDKNIYKFVHQLEIMGTEKRIPDGIVYVNGLPLVVFEFKSAIREDATGHDPTETAKFIAKNKNNFSNNEVRYLVQSVDRDADKQLIVQELLKKNLTLDNDTKDFLRS
jgi:type I restriction enzyme R subunit